MTLREPAATNTLSMRPNRKQVARKKRNEFREHLDSLTPDSATLHPGYLAEEPGAEKLHAGVCTVAPHLTVVSTVRLFIKNNQNSLFHESKRSFIFS
jgi:hypothetical protein